MKDILSYDPMTGIFTWKVSRSWRIKIGDAAGTISPKGYILISVSGRPIPAHRLAFYFIDGFFPDEQVDHIDGDRANNIFSNLRKCSAEENNENRKTPSNNTSGYIGVSKSGSGWRSRIKHNGKYLNLGTFETKDLAYNAYLKKKSQIHSFNPVPRESPRIAK